MLELLPSGQIVSCQIMFANVTVLPPVAEEKSTYDAFAPVRVVVANCTAWNLLAVRLAFLRLALARFEESKSDPRQLLPANATARSVGSMASRKVR
jgi:hypothetical protein